MIFGIVALVVGLVMLALIHFGRLTIQIRGGAAVIAGIGIVTILLEAFG